MAYRIKDQVKFLADAGRILGSSLDYKVTLKNIARLAVTYIADFCVIDLFEKDENLHRVAARFAGTNPDQKKLAEQFFRYPADPRNKQAIYEAARTGKPVLVKHLTEKWIHNSSRFPEERELSRKLGMRSVIFVPLKSRNKIIGVLTLVSSDKKFSYSEDNVILAQELANRAGIAVDNAHLFSQSQEALKLRDLFISMAAHELRTPLTTIHGYIQLLHSKLKGSDSQTARWVKDLSEESTRLTNLVKELLEVNRIKTGQFEFSLTECSLKEVIKRAITDFQFTYPRRLIIFQDKVTDGQDIVIGDFDKLLQLIINLFDNAAKFSSPESKILVRMESKIRHLYLSIRDQGKGIPKKDLPEIFEKFHKGSGHTEKGVGLGLFLAKIITTKHRGKIQVYSKENVGTTVKVVLPRAKR